MMLRQGRRRLLRAATSGCPKLQQQPIARNITNGNTRGHGGGGGWNQSGAASFLRRGGRGSRFRDRVPLPWVALVGFQAVEFCLAAYEVETEDLGELIQRCNFHIASASAGDTANLASLQELLHLVHDSTLAFGPTALPKLLDSGVILVALRGAESANPDVSALCYNILAVLSQNRHVAQRMAREPSLRAVLVEELRRQVKGWNSSPDPGAGGANLGSGEGIQSPEAHGRDGSALGPMEGGDLGAGAGARAGARSRGGARVAAAGRAGGVGRGGQAGEGLRPPPASIVVDPIHLTLTLETLRNVMRASRRRNRDESSGSSRTAAAAGESGYGGQRTMLEAQEEEEMPWPFRLLYGRDNYHVGERAGGYDETVDVDAATGDVRGVSDPGYWPLDRKLVADIAELMLSAASVRGNEVGMANEENAALGEVLEAAAASALREISCHPPLLGMLLRRRPLVGLVAVSQDSLMAEQASIEGAINICKEYRRVHGLPEPTEAKVGQEDVIEWVNKTLAEEWAGSPSGDLGDGEADRAFVRQAERSMLPLSPYHGVLLNLQMSAGVGMALGLPWGAGRRWMAWRRAGETFSGVSRLALPRALLLAGLRAGLGAAALVATHGPVGFRPQARPWALDAAAGARGTLAMSAAREAVELGYLYAILRLFPYCLLPSLAISAVVWNDHRYGGALGDWEG